MVSNRVRFNSIQIHYFTAPSVADFDVATMNILSNIQHNLGSYIRYNGPIVLYRT